MTTLLLIYCILNVVQGQEKSVAENELHMAAAIQETMLPSTFPPYPDRHEFDIFASMSPAKEVGGDFYDFFLIDDDHLALVIADVSGKGVPAALYMMVTKSMIKSQTLVLGKEGSTSEILCNLNDQLCEKNTLNMFVTVWLGIVTISTGELIYSNAGHEYPIFKRGEEPFSVLKEKHSPPLGCMEGIRYKEFKTKLDPGDIVFLYTDGVAEATNRNNELFGLDRMLKSLNDDSRGERAAVDIDFDMRYSVDLFVNGAPQFDDLTMLTFKYYGGGPMNKEDSTYDELTVKADVNNLDKVQGFIDERLEAAECSMKAQTQIDVAVEEIYVNICHYAYKDKDGKGDANIKMKINDGVAEIVFEDSGIKYDPLSNVEPDITLSAEEREIGGLGIFITKKTMDEVLYEYKDGRNVLTLRKKI
jgi:sigma-B regulation protein RsbU (phosphoserine phosphatase)